MTISIPLAGCTRTAGTADADAAIEEESDAEAVSESAGTAASARKKNRRKAEGDVFPVVVLHTSLGELSIKLNVAKAPQTVNNFLHYVEVGHYNQTIFHQVDADYVALAGSYTADLVEKQGRYPIPNEADNGLKNLRGTIAMARSPKEIDSSTCQFFINLNDNPSLDHRGDSPDEFGYCVFGELIKGMEILDKLAKVGVHDTDDFEKLPIETVLIETAYRTK
ncbi:MAG TPA: peptidylprolyl isomerase [Pirellulales bacterium]|nr:peptidylprolyl isomerase [Pirellulales bacterium]